MDPEKRTIATHLTEVNTSAQQPSPGIQRGMTAEIAGKTISPQHVLFCRMMGMPLNYEHTVSPSIWKVKAQDKKLKGLYPRVRTAYQWHTFQYWLVAVMSNSMLWLQICFGAALTALGGAKSDKVSIAIILLGAFQTVIGGFLTYFKSRNQPNRARQFRLNLRKVLDAIENAECMLRDPAYVPPVYRPQNINMLGGSISNSERGWLTPADSITIAGVEGLVLRLMEMYMEAVKEATDNYPDFWMVNKGADQTHTAVVKDMVDQLKAHGAVQINSGTTTASSSGSGSSTGQNTSVQSGITGINARPSTGLPGHGVV